VTTLAQIEQRDENFGPYHFVDPRKIVGLAVLDIRLQNLRTIAETAWLDTDKPQPADELITDYLSSCLLHSEKNSISFEQFLGAALFLIVDLACSYAVTIMATHRDYVADKNAAQFIDTIQMAYNSEPEEQVRSALKAFTFEVCCIGGLWGWDNFRFTTSIGDKQRLFLRALGAKL
jgi:hypothetical protein